MKQIAVIISKVTSDPDIPGIVGPFEKDIIRLPFERSKLHFTKQHRLTVFPLLFPENNIDKFKQIQGLQAGIGISHFTDIIKFSFLELDRFQDHLRLNLHMATINNPIFTVTGMPVKRIESIGHQQGIIIQIYLNVLYFIFAVSHTVGHTVDDAQQKMSLFRITAPRGIGIIMNKIL